MICSDAAASKRSASKSVVINDADISGPWLSGLRSRRCGKTSLASAVGVVCSSLKSSISCTSTTVDRSALRSNGNGISEGDKTSAVAIFELALVGFFVWADADTPQKPRY